MAAGGYSITLGYKIWGSRPSCAKDLKKKKKVIKQTVENNSWDESIGVGLVSARGNKAAAAWTSQRGRAMTPWTFSGRAHCFGFFFVVLFHDLMLFSVVPDWSRCDHGIGSSRPLIPCSVKPVATCQTRGSSWRKYAWFVVNTLEIIPLNWEIQSVHISANISVTSHFAG